MLFFLIPLVGKSLGLDWVMVCRLLGGTLRSVLAQTDPDFRVMLAGQDRPDIPELEDPRVTFLRAEIPYPADPSLGNNDKFAKFDLLTSAALEANAKAVAFMDADDRVSKNLVGFYRENPHPFGYLYSDGYVWDYANHHLAPSHAVLKAPFHMRCGTALILNIEQLRHDFSGDTEAIRRFVDGLGKHTEYKKRGEAASRPFANLPFPAAVYVLNHGSGLHYRRGWNTNAKVRRHERIRRYRIAVTPEIRDEFSLDGDFALPDESAFQKLKLFFSGRINSGIFQ